MCGKGNLPKVGKDSVIENASSRMLVLIQTSDIFQIQRPYAYLQGRYKTLAPAADDFWLLGHIRFCVVLVFLSSPLCNQHNNHLCISNYIHIAYISFDMSRFRVATGGLCHAVATLQRSEGGRHRSRTLRNQAVEGFLGGLGRRVN
jgi:hypothetical protein